MNLFKCLAWTTRLDKILDHVEPADTVRFHRGLFIHHAIFVGNGRAIHHHLGPNDGEVIEVTLEYLAKGDLMTVMKVTDTPFAPKEVMKRARSCIGPLPYSLHDGNCEHFTSWVYYGMRESKQLSGLCRYELRLLQCVKHHGGGEDSDEKQQPHMLHKHATDGQRERKQRLKENGGNDLATLESMTNLEHPDVTMTTSSSSSSSDFEFNPPRPPKYRHTKNPARIACNHARSWLKVLAVQSVVGLAAFPLYKCSLQAELLRRMARLRRPKAESAAAQHDAKIRDG